MYQHVPLYIVHCTVYTCTVHIVRGENIGWIPPQITWQVLTKWWKVGNRLATLVLSLHKIKMCEMVIKMVIKKVIKLVMK